MEQFDPWAASRNRLRGVAEKVGDYAGIPMPLDDAKLVVDPTHPAAAVLASMGGERPPEPQCEPDPDLDGAEIVNRFWSCARSSDIVMFRRKSGRIDWGLEPGIHNFPMQLRTLGVSDAWGIEQESNAVYRLATLVSHRQFKHYMLTGMFLETSRRSRVTYAFRRLRPTVAMNVVKDQMRIMCTLCLHPIAYYSGTWGGAMCPTDDVLAHLMLMRGDEPLFWRRANQHPAYRPEAGL